MSIENGSLDCSSGFRRMSDEREAAAGFCASASCNPSSTSLAFCRSFERIPECGEKGTARESRYSSFAQYSFCERSRFTARLPSGCLYSSCQSLLLSS